MRTDKLRTARLIVRCVLAAALIVLYAGAGGAQGPGQPLLVMQPSESEDNLGLNTVEITGSRSGEGRVDLSPNKVALFARGNFCRDPAMCDELGINWGRNIASRKAQMYRDFCVPNRDAVDCASGVSDPPEDLVATVSFDAQRIWTFKTFASGTASLKVNAQILDLQDGNRRVAYQGLDDMSQGSFLGKIKTIAKVPVPLPEFDDEQVVQPVVFTIRLRRGHVHRLILTVLATADSGVRPFAEASTDMTGTIPIGSNPGGVEVTNVSIAIAPSADDRFTALENRVTALEQAVFDIPAADEAQSTAFDEKMSGLSGGVNDLTLDVEDVKTQMQSTQAQLAAAIQSTQASLSAAIQATQADVAGVQTRVGGLETQVGTMQIQFNGHTHDCAVLRPADGANGIGRGLSGQFTISCGAAKQP